MRNKIVFGILVVVSIVIILFNSVNSLKYLTCRSPEELVVTIDEVEDDEVTITFDTTDSASTFRTYAYHMNDDTLYVGAKYWVNPFSNTSSRFTVTISTNKEVSEIIIKGGTTEEIVYPAS